MIAAFAFLPLAVLAGAAAEPQATIAQTSDSQPTAEMQVLGSSRPDNCRVQPQTASVDKDAVLRGAPDGEAMMIAAVERQIDGCPVLIAYGSGDMRPLPEYSDKGTLSPAR